MMIKKLITKYFSESSTHPKEKLKNISEKIKNGDYKKIAVLLGNGIHKSSGILNLNSIEIRNVMKQFNVPFPEAVFDLNYFQLNPFPLYKILNKLIPVTAKPGLPHLFVKALEDRNLLLLAFTKNIDGLELKAGINEKKIIFAHGNLEKFYCSSCHKPQSSKICYEHIKFEEPPFCECGAPIKPDVLFVGEKIDEKFYHASEMLAYADLMILIGCHLTVFPFSSLPMINKDIPRVVISESPENFVKSGFDFNGKDIFLQGENDEIIQQIFEINNWDYTKSIYEK